MSVDQSIINAIKHHARIIIHRHLRPDPDALGSQVGLKRLLQSNFPDKVIQATGKDEPSLTWLATMDQVSDEDFSDALIIVCDTANTARIDDPRYQRGKQIIKIDHHPNDDDYGEPSWVDTSASSTSELIARLAFQNNWTLDAYTAKLLYAGILGDTGRFLYSSTTAQTLEIAARLRQYDVDFTALSQKMDSFSYPIAKLQSYVYDQLEIDESGAARILISQKLLQTYHLSDAQTAAIVSSPGRIEQVKSWAIFVEQEDGSYRVRLRSKQVPINQIAKQHNGGGHPLASGAYSSSKDENDQIYQELKKQLLYCTHSL